MIQSIFFDPWIWICPVLIVILALLGFVALTQWARGRANKKTHYDDGYVFWLIGAIIAWAVGLIFAATYFAVSLVPYDASFYNTYRMTGTVTEVEAAFNGDEGSMSQVFVAKVDGIDEFIKSDDQRFRTVEVGDDVALVCSKIFNYWQEPYYDCSFAS
jgi:hypothetical protein